ncbi:MAG: 50S ribosomal protein L35 [Candidatus Handelsmanbacteria bacterium RIFCSPLOWO2_12_FULL_64_10]|uniref:Large ribosomal subunit protein bL35 n=1 Tax=Handelsmanbacteria sp. (strain RIFCSPLOWO2_12_FULL_64_10) TaxID=1817868 RepID=A0A1F6CBD6_HANXR|nr:MAG: 50S ribosomal protein L35 [Candidatus Handelsmanbacteria bacterium RIFCSPLOWO2_12_FULL_64_10]
MPKVKTHKNAAKRFKVKGGGRVKREKAFATHLMTGRSTKRKRNLRKGTGVSSADLGRVKRMLTL